MYNNEKTDYSFYLQVNRDSPYWTLAKYFANLGNANSKEKMLSAINAYWLPMAVQYEGKDTNSVKLTTINCIYQLQQQIQYWQSLEFKLLPTPSLSNSSLNQETIPLEIKRYRVNPDSRYWLVLNYFQSPESTFTEEQMILWSSSAYWQPLAKRHLGFCQSEQDWLSVVTKSVKALEQHIEYLQVTNDVHLRLLGVSDSPGNQSLSNNVISLSGNHLENQTSPNEAHSASSLSESSEALNQSPSDKDPTSNQPEPTINWIEQIDDPLLKPRPNDDVIDKMFG